MWHSQVWTPFLIILLSAASLHGEGIIKSSTFLSPPVFLKPGTVVEKNLEIPFPKGHIALKGFHAELVDETGHSVPLHETYLHHWIVDRFYVKWVAEGNINNQKLKLVRNTGICPNTLFQYFGLGAETRRTPISVPDPYGIEVGNPDLIPDGYDEMWLMTIHAIDTRQVEDPLGCTECRRNLYNVTIDEFGKPLRKEYKGGLSCCHDNTQCRLKKSVAEDSEFRKIFMKYTVDYVEWSKAIVPARVYVFDVTQEGDRCLIEYYVPPCDQENINGECLHVKSSRVAIPRGGDIIYAAAHQHAGGVGSTLYGQDGRVLCASLPTYGGGEGAGDEEGYIVEMSTCYPKPGSVRVADGEILTHESNYTNTQDHTGVMGLFYILVADPQPQSNALKILHSLPFSWGAMFAEYQWAFILVGGLVLVALVVGISHRKRYADEGYQSV